MWINGSFSLSARTCRTPPNPPIVQGHGPDQGKLKGGDLTAGRPIRPDDPYGVLPRIEPGDLRDEGTIQADADPPQELPGDALRKGEVLGTDRIDGGGDDFHPPHGKVRGREFAHREYRRVVVVQIGPQCPPHLRVRVRGVDMAAPDPPGVPLSPEGQDARGPGIVNEDEIVDLLQEPRIGFRVLPVGGEGRIAQALFGPLQSVVDRLGDLEERFIAVNDLPIRDEAEIVQEGNDRPEELGNPSPVGRGVDMQHPGASQGPRTSSQAFQDGVGGDSAVIPERPLPYIDVLQHILLPPFDSRAFHNIRWISSRKRGPSRRIPPTGTSP